MPSLFACRDEPVLLHDHCHAISGMQDIAGARRRRALSNMMKCRHSARIITFPCAAPRSARSYSVSFPARPLFAALTAARITPASARQDLFPADITFQPYATKYSRHFTRPSRYAIPAIVLLPARGVYARRGSALHLSYAVSFVRQGDIFALSLPATRRFHRASFTSTQAKRGARAFARSIPCIEPQ